MTYTDVQVATDGEGREFVLIPDGFCVCLISVEQAERFAEWTETFAFRIVTSVDGSVAALETTRDEDWVTSPEAEK